MQSLYRLYAIVLLGVMGLFTACETDFVNPNAPTDAQILSTKDGLLNLALGMRTIYSTDGLRFIIETPAITTREAGITTTFQNMIELEDGGTALPNFNSNVEGLWATMMRVMGMAEDIINNAASVELEAGTSTGLVVYAHLFKALAIGSLAQNYDQVVTQTSPNNDAQFVSREEAFNTAINLLDEALKALAATAVSDEFTTKVNNGEIDLENTISATLARYYLFVGNYDAAINSASSVDANVASVFKYDTQNPNPIWNRVFQGGDPNFQPQDGLGLPAALALDANDGRIAFYTDTSSVTNQNGYPLETLEGFFTTDGADIPVYLPGEMQLIIAEANVRKGSPDLNAAKAALDAVRTKTDDIFDVNAGLDAFNPRTLTAEVLLTEIYKNRRAELFLTGMSLEDSRRFDRPQPNPAAQTFTDERNRNFYPFPLRERSNNTNTPSDPAI